MFLIILLAPFIGLAIILGFCIIEELYCGLMEFVLGALIKLLEPKN